MRRTLLQNDPVEPIRPWLNGNWNKALINPYTELMGEGLFGVLVGAAIIVFFYFLGEGDLAAPSVALILISGFLVAILPPGVQTIAFGVAFVGTMGAVLSILLQRVSGP